jgi:hypothetical protein
LRIQLPLHTDCEKKIDKDPAVKSWLCDAERSHCIVTVETHAEIIEGLLDYYTPHSIRSTTLSKVSLMFLQLSILFTGIWQIFARWLGKGIVGKIDSARDVKKGAIVLSCGAASRGNNLSDMTQIVKE